MAIKQIYISPSQQPNNKYKGMPFSEEEAMHIFCKEYLLPKLEAMNYAVRTSEVTGTMYTNVSDANKWMSNKGLYIAFHTNASTFGENDGTLVLAYPSSKSQVLAKLLYDKIAPGTPSSDEGIRINKGLYELRETDSPAALVEIYYHDNLDDVKWGITHFEMIAEAAAKAIDEAAKRIGKM